MAMNTDAPQITDTQNQPLEQIHQIAQWFKVAVPEPSPRNTLTQVGVHFEEVFEMARTLEVAGTTRCAKEQLKFAADVLSYFQRHIKSGDLSIDFDKIDRVALLNAPCDQIVTAVGVAHMLGMNIESALKEVANSNDSKFGEDGSPIFNNHPKIMKGPNYKSPDLTVYADMGVPSNG